jgi:hypothetical protein
VSHIHWVAWGTGTPKDRDEVNRRDVYECDGWLCVLEVIGDPLIFNLIRKVETLVRTSPTFSFRYTENTMRWKWKIPRVGCGR